MKRRMSTLDRARLAWSVFRGRGSGPPMQRKAAPYIWPAWRRNQPQWQLGDFSSYIEEGFDLNALIYSAIMYKVRAGTIAPLIAYQGDKREHEALDPKAPLSKLLARPNPQQSWMEFQGQNIVYLNISGNVYVYIDREARTEQKAPRPKNGKKPPAALWSLRPDRVYILPDDKRGIKGYLYAPEGTSQDDWLPILPQNMMHIKLPNPGDPLEGMGYGLSPISPLAHSGDVDNSVTKFLKLFFEQGTMVSGLLKFSDRLDDADVARARERWKELYGGYQNWADVGVLDEGGEFERISMTFEEMGFETLDERNESRILGPFGVPPILIGSRIGLARSTYSNYELARRAFWEDTMVPELKLFETEYAYHLEDDDTWVAHDLSDVPALRKNIPEIVDSWVALVERGVPKKDAAELVGLPLPELPDGDVSYMPLTLVPIKPDGQPKIPPAPKGPAALAPGKPEGDEEEGKEEDEEGEQKGGPGSGHYGHAGRPGQRGGSRPAGTFLALGKHTRRQARLGLLEVAAYGAETGNEAAVGITADGSKLNDTIQGNEDQVMLMGLDLAGDYEVLVHNHPRATSFSLGDFKTILSDPDLKHMLVVSSDGAVHRISRTPRTQQFTRADVYRTDQVVYAYGKVSSSINKANWKKMRKGRLTEDEAWRDTILETAEGFSRAVGLDFQRVTPEELGQ